MIKKLCTFLVFIIMLNNLPIITNSANNNKHLEGESANPKTTVKPLDIPTVTPFVSPMQTGTPIPTATVTPVPVESSEPTATPKIEISTDNLNSNTSLEFTDVEKNHFAYEAIRWMHFNKLIVGYPNKTFKPNNSISKEEFATILVNTFVLNNYSVPENPTYFDVDVKRWSYEFIEKSKGYLTNPKNIDSDFFYPQEEIQREDVTYSVIKALGIEKDTYSLSSLNIFNDQNSIFEELKKYISIAVENNIIKGYPTGNPDEKYFAPKSTITRAEIAVIIYNAFQLSQIDPIEEPSSSEHIYPLNGKATWIYNDYFKTAIPNSWIETSSFYNDGDSDIIIRKSYSYKEKYFLTFNVRNYYSPNMDISDYIKIFTISAGNTLDINSAKEIKFKGYSAAELLISLSLSKQKMLVIIGPQYLYEIFYVSKNESFDSYIENINEVINNTDFIEQNNIFSKFKPFIKE